jgi:hypothetical protein
VVGLVVRYSFSHPVWSGTLVGNTHLLCDIRRADVGDNQLLRQLNISNPHMSLRLKFGIPLLLAVIAVVSLHDEHAIWPTRHRIFEITESYDPNRVDVPC